MKFKLGDKVKIVNPTSGCEGASGLTGIVTNENPTDGLAISKPFPVINVRVGKRVWRVNEDGCKLVSDSSKFNDLLGKIIVCRNGERYLVCKDERGIFGIGENGFVTLDESSYKYSLECIGLKEFDIMRIIYPKRHFLSSSLESNNIIWERLPEPKEMTVREVESILGYPIKIVRE